MTNQPLEQKLEQIIECIFVAGTHAYKHGKWQGSALAKDDLLTLLDEARIEELEKLSRGNFQKVADGIMMTNSLETVLKNISDRITELKKKGKR